MSVRKYRTNSIQEAVFKIKKDLGPEAIILSTRRIPGRSLPVVGRDKFEVAALLPEDLKQNPQVADGWKRGGTADLKEHEPNADFWRPDVAPKRRQGTLQEELVSIKDMLFSMNQHCGLPDYIRTHPEVMRLYARFVRAGISEGRVKGFIDRACQGNGNEQIPPQEIGRRIFKQMFRSISVCNPFLSGSDRNGGNACKLMAFVGPTGVGKTTTIAKLAADLHLKQRKKVGLVSIDNYRIGAIEQLKTYAAIIGLPYLSAFTKEDVQTAARRLENQDVVLIDTAGQGYLDRERLRELAHLLSGEPKVSTHLVLSLVTRTLDMQAAAKQFSRLDPVSYIFTKVDETSQRGNIIDQVYDYNLPISFITYGQNVPEDIMAATKKNISQLIFDRS